jgi:hypothetical protein
MYSSYYITKFSTSRGIRLSLDLDLDTTQVYTAVLCPGTFTVQSIQGSLTAVSHRRSVRVNLQFYARSSRSARRGALIELSYTQLYSRYSCIKTGIFDQPDPKVHLG